MSGKLNCTSCTPSNDLHGQQCVSNGCFTGCKTCADPSQSHCFTCLDGYSFLQIDGYRRQCLQQCPQLYFVTVISSTISIYHAKSLVTNQLVYGSSSTQVKITMSGYQAYSYNAVVAGITVSIAYAQGQSAIGYTYSFASVADNSYITLSFTFTGHLLPGSTLTLVAFSCLALSTNRLSGGDGVRRSSLALSPCFMDESIGTEISFESSCWSARARGLVDYSKDFADACSCCNRISLLGSMGSL